MKSSKPIRKEAARADPDIFQAGVLDDRRIEQAKALRALSKAQADIKAIAERGKRPICRLRIFGGWIETTDPERWQAHVKAASRGRIHVDEPLPYSPKSEKKSGKYG